MPYDDETMFPMPRALFFKMRAALRFYARAGNYKPWRNDREPVMRDRGLRALTTLNEVDALWVKHDTMLVEKDNTPSAT